jgi:hypothetical protein
MSLPTENRGVIFCPTVDLSHQNSQFSGASRKNVYIARAASQMVQRMAGARKTCVPEVTACSWVCEWTGRPEL